MKTAFVIYSSGRAGRVETLRWLYGEDVFLCIPEGQRDGYAPQANEYGATLLYHPDNVDRLYKKIAWVHDHFKNNRTDQYDCVVKVDDDISYLRDNGIYIETDEEILEKSKVVGEDFKDTCKGMATLCSDLGTVLFGFGSVNKFHYYNPSDRFKFLKAFDASIMGYLLKDTTVSIDHSIIVKNEYDIQLQVIRRYGKMLVDGRYRQVQSDMNSNVGGMSAYRNHETIELSKRRLSAKWGDVIKFTKKSVVFKF